MNKILLLATFCLFHTVIFSQQSDYRNKIKGPKSLFGDRCKEYNNIVTSFPRDIRFDIVVLDRQIILTFPSEKHFKKLFDDSFDGVAVDIIDKNQYSCIDNNELLSAWPNRGLLLDPVFKNELLKYYVLTELNTVAVNIGFLPYSFEPENVECNLLVLQKKALCSYESTAGLEMESWALLNTGLYWDTIPRQQEEFSDRFFEKSITFKIPFNKNKSTYDSTDIKPLYDSLNVTDYEITDIWIKAYSSVEGTVKENDYLQFARAKSIIKALEKYQTNKIKPHIKTSENWSQFARSIRNTEFEFLRNLSKEEVKNKLFTDKILLNKIEPLLAKQRYAEIKLDLRLRKSILKNPDLLISVFDESIRDEDLDKAIKIQKHIFKEIKDRQLPARFINLLEIPEKSEFGPLFNNLLLFELDYKISNRKKIIEKFEEIEKFTPDSWKIKYNLLSLRIEEWANGDSTFNYDKVLYDQIQSLNSTPLDETLLARLKINYYLVLVQYHILNNEYDLKRDAIKKILAYYRNSSLNEDEIFSISKFLSFNSEFETAINILTPEVNKFGVSEDILFYYLRLYFVESGLTFNDNSKQLVRKAIARNKERFCQFFNSKSQGGASFQLRNSEFLNNIYCETCNDQNM
ncbi:hypothetical protein OO013_01940 [Mangrovivirga sp. M17]|uniref:Uncharacterized protein n=1 Tax=Mangrovivirga halotolerans TaxID=2993936 RepID=A0ABT3RLA8_9BACT|nr:hypothetical protein [Mangrovivirga halotolerans]MCX2742604.1 hypothetical protein [Mangrovivirga halotolerans]